MKHLINLLDLNNFDKHKNIFTKKYNKVFEIINKKTGKIYIANILAKPFELCISEKITDLFNKISLLIKFNHPSLLKIIGYSPLDFENNQNAVLIMEHAIDNILSNNGSYSRLNDTKKLIIIYGIASAISFLHSHNILNPDFSIESIFLDEFLYPKILVINPTSPLFERSTSIPIIDPTESSQSPEYSKSNDVYSFASITYEILTNSKLFDENQIEEQKKLNHCYKTLIEKCITKTPEERPTSDEIIHMLKTDPEFITNQINEEEYFNYIQMIENEMNSKSEENTISINEIDEQIIDYFMSLGKMKELMIFLDQSCEFETISNAFDKCFLNDHKNYIKLCKEGILMDNAVAHHKYATALINDKNSQFDDINKARFHLEESIKKGFTFSYFSLARLLHEYYKDDVKAIMIANEGAEKGDKYAKCLLGYFIAQGIGTKKDRIKGVSMIIKSGADDYYERFATLIALYYVELAEKAKSEIKNKHVLNESTKEIKFHYEDEFENDIIEIENDEVINSIVFEEEEEEFEDLSDGNMKKSSGMQSEAWVEYEEIIEYEIEEQTDEELAFKWFEKAYKINKTCTTINNYGICYLDGFGVQKNIQKAKDIFNEGAKLGHSVSLHYLSLIQNDSKNAQILNSSTSQNEIENSNESQQTNDIETKNDEHISKHTDDIENKNKEYESQQTNDVETKSDERESQQTNDIETKNDEHESQQTNDVETKSEERESQQTNDVETKSEERESQQTNDIENKNDEHESQHTDDIENKSGSEISKSLGHMKNLINNGEFSGPIEYAMDLYKNIHFEEAFDLFSMVAIYNHPIAKYFKGVMLFNGQGCNENRDEAIIILKDLAQKGVQRASEFLQLNSNNL